jgi:hypothetical protein
MRRAHLENEEALMIEIDAAALEQCRHLLEVTLLVVNGILARVVCISRASNH